MSIPSSTTDKESIAISLGSNQPYLESSPQQIVLAAIERLRSISVSSKASSLYRSEPIDCPADVGDFINAAMVLRLPTEISPLGLLSLLQGIEADFGRRRGVEKNQARTLDLDIITFKNQVLESEELTLPHARAAQRKFVLRPLAEISPDIVLPGQAMTIGELLVDLPSSTVVELQE